MDLDISDEELQNAIRTEKTFQQRSRLMMAALLACVMLMGSAIISLDVNAVAMAPASAKNHHQDHKTPVMETVFQDGQPR